LSVNLCITRYQTQIQTQTQKPPKPQKKQIPNPNSNPKTPKKQIPNPKAPKPQKNQIPNPTQNPKKPNRNRLPTQKNVIEREHLLLLDVKGIEVAPELVEAHAGGREDAGEEGREAAEAEVVAGKCVRVEEAKELLLDAAAEMGARHQLLDGRGG